MTEDNSLKLDTKTQKTTGQFVRLSRAVQQVAVAIGEAVSYSIAQLDRLNLLSMAAQQAAQGQQALAKATQAAGKAAKGSLAAFDKLNVLERKAAAVGGGSAPPKGDKEERPDKPSQGEEKLPALSDEVDAGKITILQAALDALRASMELLRPPAIWLWENYLKPLATWSGDMIVAALEGVAGAFGAISNWITENQEVLGGFFGWIGQLFDGVAETVRVCLESILALWNQCWITLGESLTAFLNLILGLVTLNWQQMSTAVLAIFQSFKTLLLTAFTGLWTAIKTGFEEAWKVVQAMWAPVAQWFSETVMTPLQTNFSHLWEKLQQAADHAKNTVLSIWEPVSKWFMEHVTNPIGQGFVLTCKLMMDSFRNGLDVVLSLGKNFVNGFLGFVEAGANLFVSILNTIIGALNSISVEIPDWVPEIGGKSFGVNLSYLPNVSIPRLAAGAVIPPNAEFAAILGDQRNGRNLEAPESLIRQIVREEGGGQEIVIRFEGSMAQLVRMLEPELAREQTRRGARIMTGGVGLY